MTETDTEFRDLVTASGWSQRIVAEQLFTTPPTVSRYLSGEIPVPKSMLKLLKMVIASERPELLSQTGRVAQANPELNQLREQIEAIQESNPAVFETVKAMVAGAHTKFVRGQGTARVKLAARQRTLTDAQLKEHQTAGDAQRAAEGAAVALGLKPRAASPGERAGEPAPPAPPAKGAQKPPPKPAPAGSSPARKL